MIKRLRRRLIATTMLAVILVFVGIMSMVNLVNHYSKEQESDMLLATLSDSGGTFRKAEVMPSPTPRRRPPRSRPQSPARSRPRRMSLRIPGRSSGNSGNKRKAVVMAGDRRSDPGRNGS